VTLPAAPGGGATVGQDPDSAGLSCCHHGREAEHPMSAVASTDPTSATAANLIG
jgi:hypothetical protein